MIDPSRNHRTYRMAIQNMKPPIVPFLPLLMKGSTVYKINTIFSKKWWRHNSVFTCRYDVYTCRKSYVCEAWRHDIDKFWENGAYWLNFNYGSQKLKQLMMWFIYCSTWLDIVFVSCANANLHRLVSVCYNMYVRLTMPFYNDAF